MAATLACGLAGDVVRTFGEVRLHVVGTSMVPSILPGDLISVRRAVAAEISCGESVLYVRDGRMVVHRVVGRTGSPENSLLITRGDRLRHNDSPVSSRELLGKVISIERGNFQRRPGVCLSGWEGVIVPLLRRSDHATYLYLLLAALRLVAARHAVLSCSNECQRSTRSVKCQA
jgi:signal peptidase I